MVFVLAAATAFVNALTSVFQRIGVESAPSSSSMHLSLITHALRRGIWLAGFGLMLLAGALLAVALRFGQLSVVQPIASTELLFLVAILGIAFHYPIHRREWAGSILVVIGLGAFFVVAAPVGGRLLPDGQQWWTAGLIGGSAVVVAILAAQRGPRWWRAASFGLAAAITNAYNAALIKATTTYITEGWGHVFTHFEPYGLVVTGLFGVFLLQNALHAGPITASRTTLITGNPLISIVLGVTLFGDRLRTGGVWIPLECLSLLVLVSGIATLAQSPLVAGSADPNDPSEFLAEARKFHKPSATNVSLDSAGPTDTVPVVVQGVNNGKT